MKQNSVETQYSVLDLKSSREGEQAALQKLRQEPSVTSAINSGASVDLKDLNFSYPNGAEIIRNLSLSTGSGKVTSILGPSGCGKTSLLRLLAGLETPPSGAISIDGAPLAMRKQAITMVFQSAALFPWLTAVQNIAFPLRSRGLSFSKARSQAELLLQLVGLGHYANRYPSQLSGGQQQRVALARALAYQPRLILMDEPFSALDSQTREFLQEDVTRLIHAMGITLVLVTHDIREAIFMSDTVCVMTAQSKGISQQFVVDSLRPREDSFRYSAQFRELRATLWGCLHEEIRTENEIMEMNIARATA